jgi:hypothetical protein
MLANRRIKQSGHTNGNKIAASWQAWLATMHETNLGLYGPSEGGLHACVFLWACMRSFSTCPARKRSLHRNTFGTWQRQPGAGSCKSEPPHRYTHMVYFRCARSPRAHQRTFGGKREHSFVVVLAPPPSPDRQRNKSAARAARLSVPFENPPISSDPRSRQPVPRASRSRRTLAGNAQGANKA